MSKANATIHSNCSNGQSVLSVGGKVLYKFEAWRKTDKKRWSGQPGHWVTTKPNVIVTTQQNCLRTYRSTNLADSTEPFDSGFKITSLDHFKKCFVD